MNKKVLVVAITLAMAMLATSLTSTVQARKTIVTYESAGAEGANYLYIPPDVLKFPPGPDMDDVLDPGGLRIAQGTYREARGVNPILGPFVASSEAIISITHRSVETIVFPGGAVAPKTGWGHGMYRVQYNITSGSYTGTLEGITVATWSWDFTKNPWIDNWGNTTYHSGTGGLEGVKMNIEGYAKGATVLYGGWARVEIIFP